ncbi:MAG: hypothetical protein U9N01_04545 [Euryarchaeota archaeon]|nr:hypothetical protein [Euryarchaeota archaeon]
MALSEEQEAEMYKQTLEGAKDIRLMRERLEKGDATMDDLSGRMRDLEIEHALWKGKLGAFVLGLTLVISLLWQGVLWAWSHVVGKS